MHRKNSNLLELDVDKLFEERSIDEIIEIEKLLDVEIERKRSELRTMVGDRYKDVLAASDAIKSMKTISEDIVNNIENITNTCEKLITCSFTVDTSDSVEVNKQKIEERTLIIQIRLALFLNEQIWIALDEENNLNAAQYYLLVQHIHTGLSLARKDYLDKLPLLAHLKLNLVVLRSTIFQKITEKLESVEITAKETSCNLNALMLLENQNNDVLLSIFIEHRKTALNTVINSSYSSVRIQVSAMVRCLITTVLLLHDCFIKTEDKNGLLWQELDEIVGENAPATLSKLELPVTPLLSYIPEIIKQFRPKCKNLNTSRTSLSNTNKVIESWLHSAQESVKIGLEHSLQLVTNVKGLHLTREESLKIELPSNWEQICKESDLPENFNVWYYFFQDLITVRARALISKIISTNLLELESDISSTLNNAVKSEKSELDLRWYTWVEENSDISKTENKHRGLSMKAKGYSSNIIHLCEKLDKKYLELLEDISQYLYGRPFNSESSIEIVLKDFKFKRKYIDKEELENYLRMECTRSFLQITTFIKNLLGSVKDNSDIIKSIICARFLQAAYQLCPNFHRCCTFNNVTVDWHNICDNFNKTSHILWMNWVNGSVKLTEKDAAQLTGICPSNIIKNLARWDEIEIQEQTEEKVFKSQIKVPLKPSVNLSNILVKLNDKLSCVLPHTLPKNIHVQFIEKNINVLLKEYKVLSERELNQIQALQYLFDIKFLTTFCIPRENVQLVSCSQEICDKLRSKIDPFDLDVFYSHLQNNVKKAALQSQMIFGCLLPSATQLVNLGVLKNKEQEKVPSLLALSVPSTSSWFPLLPITVPSQKTTGTSSVKKDTKGLSQKPPKPSPKRSHDSTSVMRQSAASLFGGLTTDWFS